MSGAVLALFKAVKDRAERAGVFGAVALDEARPRLTGRAANSAEPAEYRLDAQQGRVWVSLVTANRWLSESIETDLLHTGDKLEDLIEEELAELDVDVKSLPGGKVAYEHYRSDDKLFTFRTALPIDPSRAGADTADTAARWLLAYEACFRRLGDMDAGGEDEE